MKIAIITTEQHRDLFDKEFTSGVTFNSFLDKDGNICISEQEIEGCDKSEFTWVKDLTKVEKDSQLKDLTKEEWLLEDKAKLEAELLKIQDKLKPIDIKPIK